MTKASPRSNSTQNEVTPVRVDARDPPTATLRSPRSTRIFARRGFKGSLFFHRDEPDVAVLNGIAVILQHDRSRFARISAQSRHRVVDGN